MIAIIRGRRTRLPLLPLALVHVKSQATRRAILVFGCYAATLMALAPHRAAADETAKASSKNWYFYRFSDQSTGRTDYTFASSALKAEFSYVGQAWNEGGTSGEKTYGPEKKFNNNNGEPADKTWPTFIGAKVPAPGTTEAEASFVGFGNAQPGFVGSILLMNYWGSYSAFAQVKESTIPAGGFGKATATIKDPWAVDVPLTPNAGDVVELHSILELDGSSLAPGSPTSSGHLNWHAALDGVSAFQSYLLDYTVTDNATNFSSNLLVAPGVRIFLNDGADWSEGGDWTGNLEFNPSSEVTPAQLKSYLDGFETGSGGWTLGSTPVRIGLQVAIPNDAAGLAGDPGMRHFLLHQDASSEMNAFAPVPEPSTLVMAAVGMILIGVVVRGKRKISE